MALPTLDELEDAYQAGCSAEPNAKNPYFFGTALWAEWNFGQSVSWKIKQHRPKERRINKRIVVAIVIVAAAGARYVLL